MSDFWYVTHGEGADRRTVGTETPLEDAVRLVAAGVDPEAAWVTEYDGEVFGMAEWLVEYGYGDIADDAEYAARLQALVDEGVCPDIDSAIGYHEDNFTGRRWPTEHAEYVEEVYLHFGGLVSEDVLSDVLSTVAVDWEGTWNSTLRHDYTDVAGWLFRAG